MEQGERADNGNARQLVELAISCGRKHQNEQTSFVHFFYTKEDEKDNAAIPVYENLLFALALMRSKSADTIQEGKGLVEKILPFQNYQEEIGKGSFPIYLHEYPHCKDRLLGIRLLPVFYTILNQFHHVIGASLKSKLIESARSLLKQCIHTNQEKPVPFSLAFTLGVMAQALGKFIEDSACVDQGRRFLADLKNPLEDASWYIPANLSDILIALQSSQDIELPPAWESFWQNLSNCWHRPSCSYIGPGWREYQLGNEPQATLYDLYMGYASGSYSYRSFIDHPFQLQAALIHSIPVALPKPKPVVQGHIGPNPWLATQNESFGLCLLGKKEPVNPSYEKGYHPLKILWGDSTHAHSFVCQGGNAKEISYEWHPDGFIGMEVSLGELPHVEDKEKARELIFFTEALEDTTVTVNDIKATTFNLGEVVQLSSAKLTVLMTFYMLEGDGNFVGHIMRGNRPAQINLKGENRLSAFDWQVFLRTINRTTPCKIKVNIQIKEG